MDSILGWITSRFFVEVAFPSRGRDLGNQIISDIKQAYIARFKTLDWMDDSVKEAATDKVRKIRQKVGYPTAVSFAMALPTHRLG